VTRIKMDFEKGGSLIADLNDRAPKSIKSIMEILPVYSTVYHTRWCGREISFGIRTKNRPPMENCSNIVSKFDITYWRDWDSIIDSEEAPHDEAIAIYYGPEMLRYHNGLLRSNIIGRILWEQEELLETIGMRIWKHGLEKVVIDLCK